MKDKKSPWYWIPTVYAAEGLPNIIVTGVSVVILLQMGMTNTQIALYTSWLQLPWIIKPLWSPFVDIFKTKRWWVIAMQMLLGAAFAGVAFTIGSSWWFQCIMFFLFLMGFSSATHDIAADGYYMIELDDHDQSFFVGIRNTVYRLAVIFGNGVLVPVAGLIQKASGGRVAFSWSLVFFGLAGLFLAIALYHRFYLPESANDKPRKLSASETWRTLGRSFSTYFTKFPLKETVVALLFLLLFRFPEALLTKMSPTFLLRPASEGGLGLSAEQYGIAYGTIGVIGLMLGGILGGILASRDGVKKWLWPMVLALTLPDLVYVYLSAGHQVGIGLVTACIFVEQFGYGFGFTALTLYMLYFSQGEFKTSHYSICTGITYLGLMLPGMVSGYLADRLGYHQFFVVVMAFCLVTFLVTALIKIDPSFGKASNSKEKKDE
ncbi:MAG: MFS transporter [Bacteroidales bacterium]|nr:MFS transporter [Bacteroidales bacterium]MBQ6186258.1 MFS transporter [Bacteroidales bacterium]